MKPKLNDKERKVADILRTELVKTFHSSEKLNKYIQKIEVNRLSQSSTQEGIGEIQLLVYLKRPGEDNKKRSWLNPLKKQKSQEPGVITFRSLQSYKEIKDDARISITHHLQMPLVEQNLAEELEQRYKKVFKEELNLDVHVLFHALGEEGCN